MTKVPEIPSRSKLNRFGDVYLFVRWILLKFPSNDHFSRHEISLKLRSFLMVSAIRYGVADIVVLVGML